ncbi:DUF305 domain-containing protein [Avibacterium paragallinarum]|uniref:DUF305 domain-containing protein n=2 Tax=Avibacterium paragallinarum TaxID=728 RepID=A0ABU7QPB5_AVIPA
MKKALLILIGLASTTVMAEMPHQPNAMQSELMASMSAMHADMEKGMQYQDADVAFAASMLPHHEGAVKMAEIELKYGKDPKLRQLAENIIKAQQSEIQFMQQWLEKHQAK